jgi:hypothetical protein
MTLQSAFVLFLLPFVIAAGAVVVSIIHINQHRRQLRSEGAAEQFKQRS